MVRLSLSLSLNLNLTFDFNLHQLRLNLYFCQGLRIIGGWVRKNMVAWANGPKLCSSATGSWRTTDLGKRFGVPCCPMPTVERNCTRLRQTGNIIPR